MSNETDKPLAGALRVVKNLDLGICECDMCTGEYAVIIADESGLAELVTAVDAAKVQPLKAGGEFMTISVDDWRRIQAAARRVREG